MSEIMCSNLMSLWNMITKENLAERVQVKEMKNRIHMKNEMMQ